MICSPPPPPDTSDQDNLYRYVSLAMIAVVIVLTKISGLHNGTFTIFSSDHCPFRYDDPLGKATGIFEHDTSFGGKTVAQVSDMQDLERREGSGFRFIPNGIPGVETRLALLYTGGLQTGRITPQKFVELTSTNPAKLVSGRTILAGLLTTSLVWVVPQERSSDGMCFT